MSSLVEEGFGKNRVIILLILFCCLISFWWISTNIRDPLYMGTANIYLYGGTIGLLLAISSWIIGTKGADFDVPLWSDNTIFGDMSGNTAKIFVLSVIAIGIVIIYSTVSGGMSAQLYGQPKFQIVELGSYGRGLLSGLAGVFEELLLIAGMFGIFYFFYESYFPLTMKSEWLSKGATIITTGLMFGIVWHLAVYGFTNMPAMLFVIFLGLVSASFIAIFNNFVVGAVVHFANNFGIAYTMAGGTTAELLSAMLLVGIVAGVLYGGYKLVRR